MKLTLQDAWLVATATAVLIPIISVAAPLDVSQCFNNLLQQKRDYASSERTSLSQIAIVSEATYEASKHDAELSGTYKFLSFSSSYSDFAEKRRQYFQLNKLDLDQWKTVAYASRTLDASAYPLIAQCIDKAALSQYGFNSVATTDRQNTGASVLLRLRTI